MFLTPIRRPQVEFLAIERWIFIPYLAAIVTYFLVSGCATAASFNSLRGRSLQVNIARRGLQA
jgi:hypothetical protein